MRRTSPLFAVASLALAAGLTGCGSGGQSSETTSASPGTSAGSSTSAASAPSSSSSDSGGGAGAGAHKVGDMVPIAEVGTMAKKAITDAGSVAMDVGAGSAQAGHIEVDVRDGTKFHMTTGSGAQKIEQIIIDKVMYVNMGPQTTRLTGGKKWLKVDARASDPTSKAFASTLESMDGLGDPTAAYAAIPDAKAKVTAADGSSTTYVTTLTAEQVKKVSTNQGPTVAGAEVGGMTITQVFDGQNRPTKATIKDENSAAPYTVTYSEWGAPLKIVAPPASQTGPAKTP